MREQLYRYIVADSTVLHGQPCIEGTRIPASEVIARVAGGLSIAEVASALQITTEAVRAALEFGATRASEAPALDDPLLALAGSLNGPSASHPRQRAAVARKRATDRHAEQ